MSTYPGNLYNGLPPHERESLASTLAAQSITRHTKTLRERVLRYVEDQGVRGATVDEIEIATDMIHQTCSARARELVLMGDLFDTGTMRRTRTGRKAAVLMASSTAHNTGVRPYSDTSPVLTQPSLFGPTAA